MYKIVGTFKEIPGLEQISSFSFFKLHALKGS